MRAYVGMGTLLRSASRLLGNPEDWPTLHELDKARKSATIALVSDALGFCAADREKVEWLIEQAWEEEEA